MEEKKRGRPPLSEEERKARSRERQQKYYASHKDQKRERDERYRANHPDLQVRKHAKRVEKYYSPKINIPREAKPIFDSLLASTGKTISELVLDSLEKQYGVNLHADITDQTHDIPTHQADE